MSKLEQALEIQREAGQTTGVLCNSHGCMCPLGALAKAYDMDVLAYERGDLEFEEGNGPYEKLSDEHVEDLLHLANAIPADVQLDVSHYWHQSAGYKAATQIFRYNDKHLRTTEAAVQFFQDAIDLRDSAANNG